MRKIERARGTNDKFSDCTRSPLFTKLPRAWKQVGSMWTQVQAKFAKGSLPEVGDGGALRLQQKAKELLWVEEELAL